MKKTVLFVMVIALFGAVVLAGCSNGDSASTPTPAKGDAKADAKTEGK